MAGPSEQELAALDIILRRTGDVRGVVGTFAGEDAAFVVQVTEEAGGDVRVWPLAVLLRDEHLPFVGGPREEAEETEAEETEAEETPAGDAGP
jgi:hypothetical protein